MWERTTYVYSASGSAYIQMNQPGAGASRLTRSHVSARESADKSTPLSGKMRKASARSRKPRRKYNNPLFVSFVSLSLSRVCSLSSPIQPRSASWPWFNGALERCRRQITTARTCSSLRSSFFLGAQRSRRFSRKFVHWIYCVCGG